MGKLGNMAAILLAALILVSLSGCSSAGAIAPETEEAAHELGRDFINDLTAVIVPLRERPAELRELDVAVSARDVSYNTGLMEDFFQEYEMGNDCQVTLVFMGSSFVVNRLCVEDGQGYYLRYQYDPKAEQFQISTRLFDAVEYEFDEDLSKAELTISINRKQVANFVFRHAAAETP